MCRTIAVLALAALAACNPAEPDTDEQVIAMWPMTVSPDHIIRKVRQPFKLSISTFPMLTTCHHNAGYGQVDCRELERRGWVVMDAERTNYLLNSFGCDPTIEGTVRRQCRAAEASWRYPHDYEDVQYIGHDSWMTLRCGTSYLAIRLSLRPPNIASTWKYPFDDVFSDTLWVTAKGCP